MNAPCCWSAPAGGPSRRARPIGCRDGPATHPARTPPCADRRHPAGQPRQRTAAHPRRRTPTRWRWATTCAAEGITVDAVLCSSAARARQTLELLKLGDPPAPDRVEIADRFYNAGGDTLINAVRELPDDCRVALLIGHAPGAPSLVHEMTDPASSTPEAVQCDRESLSGCCAGPAGVRG